MGNHVSAYAPTAGESGVLIAPVALAWGREGEIWLADEEARRVDQLAFDGQTLRWLRSLNLSWERAPCALARHESGILAIADGNRILLCDPSRGDVLLHVWTAPNDGSDDGFQRPVALAFDPVGDLAVVEEEGRCTSFIFAALKPFRTFLPRLMAREAR